MRFHGFESNVYDGKTKAFQAQPNLKAKVSINAALGAIMFTMPTPLPVILLPANQQGKRSQVWEPSLLPNSGVDSKIRLNARNVEHKPRASKESACGEAASLPGGLNELK